MGEQIPNLIEQLNNASQPVKPKPASSKASDYGKAPVGYGATDTHQMRLSALRSDIPGFDKIAQMVSQGKIPGKGLCTDLAACDKFGVGVWTYIQLPGGRKADGLIKQMTGMDGQQVRDTLKAQGYAFYKPGQCWRTRDNGTPAVGRFKATPEHAYKHALGDDD
ncbi:MAG: hypothetical protein K8963_09255 [Proteobacteria bacterium]|nr:hypothetical protein [Pseudomonadota bacterium]